MTQGLLLFAHGARDPEWARPFEAVASRLARQRPGIALRLAYLEFMSPSLEEAAHELAAQGCSEIHIVPMFLGTGGHVRRDIPPLLQGLQARYGSAVQWLLHPPLGEQERIIQAMTDASLAWLDQPAEERP